MTTALEGVRGQRHAPAALYPGKDPVPIVQEAGVWTGAENLAPTGIRSPDRPARSQSLYRLLYPAHNLTCTGLELNLGLCSEKMVTDRLKHDTAALFRCILDAAIRMKNNPN